MTHRTATSRRLALSLLAAALVCLAFAGLAEAKPAKQKPKGTTVNVMTRNLYLGADLGLAIRSTSRAAFFEANGEILRSVDASNFPVRAKGLAKEILEKEPDLVGLQEVALWRTAEPTVGPVQTGIPTATTVISLGSASTTTCSRRSTPTWSTSRSPASAPTVRTPASPATTSSSRRRRA